MTRQLLTIGLFALTVQLFGQTTSIVGLWKTPKAPAVIHYKFDSNGTMKYNFYGCLSNFQRTGHYTVSKDSIFITYDSLTAEEKLIYQVKTTPPTRDTLLIIDRHKIKVNDGIFIFDFELKQAFTLADTLFIRGQIYRTYGIHFTFDKTQLSPDSKPLLDSIADFLIKNKHLAVEVGFHFDTKTNEKYTQALTDNYARTVAQYFIDKGISADRIKYRGYGGTQPLIYDFEIKTLKTKEEKEKAHQKNRRAEIKILRTDYDGK